VSIPQEAITAAHRASAGKLDSYEAAKAALEAAAPIITAAKLEQIRAVIDRGKIQWLIHTLDLIDKLAASRGLDTSSEAQDDLRKFADLLEDGDD